MIKKSAAAVIVLALLIGMQFAGIEKISKEQILRSEGDWKDNYQKYQVDESLIETLKNKIKDNLQVDVYMALWCHDTKVNLPKFIKIIDSLKRPGIVVNYYTCKRKENKGIKFYVEKYKVSRIPTFIFSLDGKEIGRIVENPKKSLIEDMIDIL